MSKKEVGWNGSWLHNDIGRMKYGNQPFVLLRSDSHQLPFHESIQSCYYRKGANVPGSGLEKCNIAAQRAIRLAVDLRLQQA